MSLTDKVQATQAGGVSLMIPAAAKHPDQAWELLKRFVSLETELAASIPNGMTMPRKSWAASAEVQADPILGSFGQCLPYARDITAELRLTGKSARVDELLKTAIDEKTPLRARQSWKSTNETGPRGSPDAVGREISTSRSGCG